jgi:hypothetical protein
MLKVFLAYFLKDKSHIFIMFKKKIKNEYRNQFMIIH